jgi:hypothetical protein
MKTRDLLLYVLLLLSYQIGLAQKVTETRSYINLNANKNDSKVSKFVKIETLDTIPNGSKIKREYKAQNSDTTFTITETNIVNSNPNPYTIGIEQPMAFNLDYIRGKANFTIPDDKEYIQVNFWLDQTIIIDAGQKILRITRNYIPSDKAYHQFNFKGLFGILPSRFFKDSVNSLRKFKFENDTLKKSLSVNMSIVYGFDSDGVKFDERKEKWFEYATDIIVVYEQNTIINIYASKYEQEGDYRILLKNRQSFSFPTRNWSTGIVTIPFKYHTGYSRGTFSVPNNFSASINAGPFLGYTLGKYKVRREIDKLVELPKTAFTCGGFINIGIIGIDEQNTFARDNPLTDGKSMNIGVFSFGLGAMFSINNVCMGIFGGYDIGLGSEALKWNYNNRFWWGFGFNYTIANGFWSTE